MKAEYIRADKSRLLHSSLAKRRRTIHSEYAVSRPEREGDAVPSVFQRAHCVNIGKPMSREKKPLGRRLLEIVGLVLLAPIILPLSLFALTLYWLHHLALYLLIWCVWIPRGKDTLLIYSDSPIWRDYMTDKVLPLVERRAVVLNWSERSRWSNLSFAVHVFRSFSGGSEFNPMVVLFRPLRRAKYFRFWSAFKEWKHGNVAVVDSLRNDLSDYLRGQ
jgi:hypothetical protein